MSSRLRLRRGLVAVALSTATVTGTAVLTAPAQAAVESSAVLSANKTELVRGEPATFTVTIPTLPKQKRATGTVTFMVDGAPMNVAVNSAGKAVLTTKTLALGGHSVSASYSGDALYTGGDAGSLEVDVIKANTTTKVASTIDPVPSGKAALIKATVARVAPGAGSLAGTVTFTIDDGTTYAPTSVPVSSSGAGQWRPKLADGTYQVTATYNGNDDFTASTSTTATINVGNPPPAAGTLDQQNLGSGGQLSCYTAGFGYSAAQTFTAGRTGSLDKVSLAAAVLSGEGAVEIQTLDANAAPSGTVIGSGTLTGAAASAAGTAISDPRLVDIPLTTAAPVTAGTSYAIVVRAPLSSDWACVNAGVNGHPGQFWARLNDGSWFQISGNDALFRTFVAS